ncbi:MAG: metal-sulfur cluster assembly factor [Thermaerobacter sp.]|nr:metal-sulfur cluster assembly factor [Thermaerobacter sp.]
MDIVPTRQEAVEALRKVIDPELGVDIVSLGLLYNVEIADEGAVSVMLTLTTPGCPLHSIIGRQIEQVMLPLPGISDVKVQLTFSPPWDPRMMNDEAREELQI